jgi:hypothetical protein
MEKYIGKLIQNSIKKEFDYLFSHTHFDSISEIYKIEYVSRKWEKHAKEIWVATMTLDLDVNDKTIIAAVTTNFNLTKRYKYFIPDSDSSRTNEIKYDAIYRKFSSQYEIIYLPEESINLFEEVVIYDPNTEEQIGFILVTTPVDKLYIRVHDAVLKTYINKLKSFDENKQFISRLCSKYLREEPFRSNQNARSVLRSVVTNPFVTEKKLKDVICSLENAGVEATIISIFENDIINYVRK